MDNKRSNESWSFPGGSTYGSLILSKDTRDKRRWEILMKSSGERSVATGNHYCADWWCHLCHMAALRSAMLCVSFHLCSVEMWLPRTAATQPDIPWCCWAEREGSPNVWNVYSSLCHWTVGWRLNSNQNAHLSTKWAESQGPWEHNENTHCPR